MLYKCRTTVPKESKWYEVEALSPEEAANDFHCKFLSALSSLTYNNREDGKLTPVHFALVEVEGYESMISRVFSHAIWRKGGVRGHEETLLSIAEKLNWKDDPNLLLSEDPEDWTGVESLDEAIERDNNERETKYGPPISSSADQGKPA